MLKLEDAPKKLKDLSSMPGLELTPASSAMFALILDGKAQITQKDSFLDEHSPDYMRFIENRLVQHDWLAADQANGLWGRSTTLALKELAYAYNIKWQDAIGRDMFMAILDGQKSPKKHVSAPNSYEWLKQKVEALGYVFDTRHNQINIIGIRGYLVEKGQVINKRNIYNDTIFVAWVDEFNKPHVEAFIASVDPGRYYEDKPLNPHGCAHLVQGQYDYVIGLHGASQYEALVQAGPVTVERWFGGDRPAKPYKETVTGIGLNIHAGMSWDLVENASAGCQVIWSAGPRGWQYAKFMNLIRRDKDRRYKYTLLED